MMQFTGDMVNMTRARLAIEGFGVEEGLDYGATGLQNGLTSVDYGVGLDTNFDWYPSIDLGVNYAESSYFTSTLGPYQLMYLTNTTPYFNIAGDVVGSTNVVVRAIFIQNQYTNNVTTKVFWNNSDVVGGGLFNVEWDGTYVDPSSGQTVTHYLYLNDYDVLGSEGPAVINGIPDNFVFLEENQDLFAGLTPATAGYTTDFQPLDTAVTNSYSYVSMQLASSSVATNSPSKNVTNYLANLSGRIQINANSNLDLSLAQISGDNYLQLRAPYQFNGSVGARIFAPFSDINLGVTNGFMTVTNLVEPSVPNWNGGIQCWSARWIYVDATGVTWDYRVLLVNSAVTPTTPSEVQDLALHATNSLVVCDVFNILRSLSIDAQNLTLTQNGPAAGSADGELNLQSSTCGLYPNPPVQNVWSNSAPNVLWLTNNGAIRLSNLGFFGGPPPGNYFALVNNGLISDYGSQFWADNFASSGVISNGMGSFTLQAQTASLGGAVIVASNNLSITSSNLVMGGLLLQAGRSLTLAATNLADTGPGNGSVWIVGTNSVGAGVTMPFLPASGDLRGTSITLFAPDHVNVVNTWPGADHGVVTYGYTNNEAVGQLLLNALSNAPNTTFTFTGVGASNAIYVDRLQLLGFSDWNSHSGQTIPSLVFNTNLVIYYADAISDGQDVSYKLNGANNNHIRWVPTYLGYFSSTNLVYDGETNTFNVGLAESSQIDSDEDGIPNASDPKPFFLSSEVNLNVYLTNANTKVAITWDTIPYATNTVFYTTNIMTSPIPWTVLTNFISPIPYPSQPKAVTVLDPLANPPRYYQVIVSPWLP
jgi:hypothetical protein